MMASCCHLPWQASQRTPHPQDIKIKTDPAWITAVLFIVATGILLTLCSPHAFKYAYHHSKQLGFITDSCSHDALNLVKDLAHMAGLQHSQGHWDASSAMLNSTAAALSGDKSSSRQPSRKRFRSMVCTNVRNDVHMREFVVRHLLLGFQHIVIYDNNQLGLGLDHDTGMLLDPFLQQGLVTHVPYHQDGRFSSLTNTQKDALVLECFAQYGRHADWLAVMDSDEVFFVSRKQQQQQQQAGSSTTNSSGRSIGILSEFLDAVENSNLNACALRFPWRMMYGEHRVLQVEGLLLDTYPRQCFSHISKSLIRTDGGAPEPPHNAKCTTKGKKVISVDSAAFKAALPQYQPHLIHYYARSVEEYISKSEQSMPPYQRLLPQAYDAATTCSYQAVPYDQRYSSTVRDIMLRLRRAQGDLGDGGVFLGPLPEGKVTDRRDYALYMFFKLRVERQHEWDEEAYLARNPHVV